MASLSDLMIGSAKKWAAKGIVGKEAEEKKKESFLSGILALAKPAAAWGSKALLTAAGIGSGGILTPLLMGLGTAGISNIFDVIGRKGLKLGADPSKIKATGKYRYGKEYAKTTSEALQKSIEERDPLSKESLIGDVVGSYISALTPKIVPGKDGKFTVEGGDLGKNVTGAIKDKDLSKLSLFDLQEEGLIPEGLSNIKHARMTAEMDKLYGGDKTAAFKNVVLGESQAMEFEKELEPIAAKMMSGDHMPSAEELKAFADPELEKKLIAESIGAMGVKGQEKFAYAKPTAADISGDYMPRLEELKSVEQKSILEELYSKQLPGDKSLFATESPMSIPPLGFVGQEEEEWFQQFIQPEETPFNYEQGGQVQGYRGGGTISDYFGGQGMTLGGSNTQSLTEILAKRR